MSLAQELQGFPPAKLAVENVSKWFRTSRQTVHALDKISIEITEGEFVCLVGFQEAALFPWLDVIGNVMFGLKLKPGLRNKERLEVAKFFIQLVGLEKFSSAHVHELSGGMKQRVALARALAPNPRVLLMDEPFAALDALTREQLYGDLQRIWKERRKTIVFVTHNVREAACLADRVVIMTPMPGRIREIFEVNLPRPREFNSIEIAQHASKLTSALKGHLATAEEMVGT